MKKVALITGITGQDGAYAANWRLPTNLSLGSGGDRLSIHIRRCMVRTNIVLDERLVKEVMKLAKARTMREAVDIALRRFVQGGRQKKLLDLYGDRGVRKDYDYKRTRSGA